MTPVPFVPREYQRQMIDFVSTRPRCALWAEMGLGKTVAVLTVVQTLRLISAPPTLVIAPLRVALSTWPGEAAKWEHLAGLVVVPVVGTVAQRTAALRRPGDVFTVNYDNLPWLVEHFRSEWPFRLVIADESTRLKGFRGSIQKGRKTGKEYLRCDTGKRAGAFARVAHTRVEHFIELTGTPSPNGLKDLWAQAWFLDRGSRLGRTFEAFKSRWFRSVQKGPDAFSVELIPLPHAQREIEAALSDICLSLRAKDWFPLEEPIVNVIRVRLPPRAREMYETLESEMFLALEGAEVEAFSAAAKTMKCLQLANGAVYLGETQSEWAEVHDAKIQALEDIVEEAAGAPVLVAYHFRSDLVRIQRAFPRARVLDKSPSTIADWNAGRIPILLAHPASAGHGLNLQDGGNIIAFFGHWWDLEQFQQIVERIGPTRQAQAGYKRNVFVHHIVAEDTIDEVVLERRESKREVQDLLMQAMRRRME